MTLAILIIGLAVGIAIGLDIFYEYRLLAERAKLYLDHRDRCMRRDDSCVTITLSVNRDDPSGIDVEWYDVCTGRKAKERIE